VKSELRSENEEAEEHGRSKYIRRIRGVDGYPDVGFTSVDVYAVLVAFGVTCPARQHAIKKLLCAGIRGKGDTIQDLNEALVAVGRACELAQSSG